MAKGKVKYRSAYDEKGNLVTLSPGRKVEGKFTCPNPECKLDMIPRQGDHNTWHFAHVGKECDYDHYLHTIAELRIQEWYNKIDKVSIRFPNEVLCPNQSNCKFYQEGYSCRKESTDTDKICQNELINSLIIHYLLSIACKYTPSNSLFASIFC